MHDGKTGCYQRCEKELFVQTGYKNTGDILTMQEKINFFLKNFIMTKTHILHQSTKAK